MSIRTVPPFPTTSEGLSNAELSSRMEASLTQLPGALSDLNEAASVYTLSVSSTSSTSNSIGTGDKTFTVATGLAFALGLPLRAANSEANYVDGAVKSYNSSTGELVLTATTTAGSGTYTSWTITMTAVGANSAGAISFAPSGNITATDVQAAIEEIDIDKASQAEAEAGADHSTYMTPLRTQQAIDAQPSRIVDLTTLDTSAATETEFTFTVPSGVKRIAIKFHENSTSSSSVMILQLKGSGSYESSNYKGASWQSNTANAQHTDGFVISPAETASQKTNGTVYLTLLEGPDEIWMASGVLGSSQAVGSILVGGSKEITGELTGIKLTTQSGTPVFDDGKLGCSYEL